MAENAENKVVDVVLRPKRQITLPKEVCERLGIGPGDMLEVALEGSTFVARPKKAAALDALREIQDAFGRSGVSGEELEEAGRRVRQQVNRERHGDEAQATHLS